jgi:hypothetical protein
MAALQQQIQTRITIAKLNFPVVNHIIFQSLFQLEIFYHVFLS